MAASGVSVDDEVFRIFNAMKVRKTAPNPAEKLLIKKAVMFCLSADKKTIIVDEGNEILAEDVGASIKDPFMTFVKMLPADDCRYGLYDCTYETTVGKKEELVFIFWAPDSAPIKNKMIYASSKDAIKKKFGGIKHEWQVNCLDDLHDRQTLAGKLTNDSVISLEGHRI